MSNPNIEELIETKEEGEAKYVRVDKILFKCFLTEGKIYPLHRNYNVNPDVFTNGETYVVDDEGRNNYSLFMLCKSTLFK